VSARVLLLSTGLARGGAETQVVQLAQGLRRRGWEVAVASLTAPSAFVPQLEAAGVAVHSLGMKPGRWNPGGGVRLIALLRRLRPNILHAHLFHANLAARLARLVSPVPAVISTLHSVAESGRRSRGARARDLAYQLTDPLGDVVVAVAEAVAARHAAAGAVRRTKLRVIPNGVDTSLFRPDPEARERLRSSLGLGSGFVWLAVGRLMWKKGYETLLAASAGCPGATLLVAGSGPDEEALRRAAPDRVRYLGQRDDVAELMRACDGVVQAAGVEGLPGSLLEAGASGMVCVATSAGGTSEAGFGVLVEPGDANALAAAMRRVMAMPAEERRGLGLAARERVIERFEAARVLAAWEDLYRELLASWT
jgi:glycosyltransferase involved in cell wall biosynthesis